MTRGKALTWWSATHAKKSTGVDVAAMRRTYHSHTEGLPVSNEASKPQPGPPLGAVVCSPTIISMNQENCQKCNKALTYQDLDGCLNCAAQREQAAPKRLPTIDHLIAQLEEAAAEARESAKSVWRSTWYSGEESAFRKAALMARQCQANLPVSHADKQQQ